GAEGLESLGAWAEQLLAESTGKRGRGVTPIDCEPLGTISSYGDDRVFVLLNGAELNEEFGKFSYGWLEGGPQSPPHGTISTTTEDAYDLGREFLRWEIATSVLGAALRINPFDEPNVRESKDNTRVVLEEYARAGKLPR